MSMRIVAFGIIALVCRADLLPAQQIAVQQPTVETFAGQTTISVPNRGRMHVGSVGRAAESRSMYGPLRTNSNFGHSVSGSSMSVGVTIHDQDELDRQTLAAAETRRPAVAAKSAPAEKPISPRADHAYRSLNRRAHHR